MAPKDSRGAPGKGGQPGRATGALRERLPLHVSHCGGKVWRCQRALGQPSRSTSARRPKYSPPVVRKRHGGIAPDLVVRDRARARAERKLDLPLTRAFNWRMSELLGFGNIN